MTDALARSEQRIAAKRPRGPGRPFEKGDARINRHGDAEAILLFDPTDARQARLALGRRNDDPCRLSLPP